MSMKETYDHMLYPSYKPTGIPWLGDVPDHWATERLKQHVDDVNEQTRERLSQDIYIALENVEGWTGKITAAENEVSFDSQVKRFRVGDVLFGKLRPYLAKVAAPNRKGLCVGEFLVLRSQQDSLSPDYLEQLLRSKGVIDTVDASTFGAKMPRADWNFIGSMLFPIPPMDEQLAIVRYLDDADQLIRAYVSAKERLIALLEEMRQAVIHQAVTRGLDPNVKLKPSGVEWLGDVPEHWSLRRLRSLASIKTGGQDTINRQDNGKYPFYVRSQTVERIDTWSYDGEAVLTAGDGVGVGKVFHYAKGKFDYHQRVYKFSDFKDVLGKFFFHYFRTALKNEVFQGTAKSTVDSLRLPMLQNFPVTIPPTPEQSAIVQHLEKMNTDMDAAMDRARRQIELMEEYRTRLIADVVTGKLDVRETRPDTPDTVRFIGQGVAEVTGRE